MITGGTGQHPVDRGVNGTDVGTKNLPPRWSLARSEVLFAQLDRKTCDHAAEALCLGSTTGSRCAVNVIVSVAEDGTKHPALLRTADTTRLHPLRGTISADAVPHA